MRGNAIGLPPCCPFWAAAGFEDTLLKWSLKPEVVHGNRNETAVSREFKLEAVRLFKERGVGQRRRPRVTLVCTRTCYASGCVSRLRTRSRRFPAS